MSVCDLEGPRGYGAQGNESVRERQTPFDFTPVWNVRIKTNEQTWKKEKQQNQTFNTENKLVVVREKVATVG